MSFEYEQNKVTITVTGADEPGAVTSREYDTQQAHIEEALDRIPAFHLYAVPPINVVNNRPSSGGGYYRNPPEIRLHRSTFASSWNRNFLFTLIHEIGHAVDYHFNIVLPFIGRTHRRGRDWQTYRSIIYNGRNRIRSGPDAGTPAYGEHFAEGYAHLLTRPGRLSRQQRDLIRQLARL